MNIQADNIADLDRAIDTLEAAHSADHPVIVIVMGPGQKSVYFGAGGSYSFVSSCEVPYLTTIGEDWAQGEVDYKFEGHPSPIPRRNMVPKEVARRIIREFYLSGDLPSWQVWEPI